MHPHDRSPDAAFDSGLDAVVRRHPAGRHLTAEQAARIAARSVCPRCDGRPAASDEESYATCIFCATGTTKPDPALTEASAPVARPATAQPHLRLVTGDAPAAQWGDDEPLALD